ncbi:MAG: YIP1 family protein [Dehalococcoidia bacterium]
MMQPTGGLDMNSLIQRLRRMAMLDASVFDEVKGDASATIPALLVVVVSTFLMGVGGWLWLLFQDFGYEESDFFLKSAVIGSVLAIVLWGVGVFVTYVMLTQIFRATADVNQLVRVMGFAGAPLALGVLMFIPGLDYGLGVAAVGLYFGLSVLAVQSATDASPGKALAAAAAGFAVWAVVLSLLVSGDGSTDVWAPGIFIFAPR